MAEKQTNKERLKEITDSIEAGINELFQSEKYMNYLRTMSRFHKYSFNNTMLIHIQKPDATLVTGYSKWEQKFKRHVKRGEKGIKLIAPTPFKKKIEQEKLDPDTKLPLRDDDGNIIMEEKEVKIPMFKPVVVFDVSQTEGEPLPTLAADLKGDVKHYEVFMEALRRSSPVPVEFETMTESMDGYFSHDRQRIAIREGMSEMQTICAAVHEITHAKLHNTNGKDAIDGKDNRTEEVEAESVSFAVCAYYGIETGENSFGYIASWSDGMELKELRSSLETINRTADSLITDIDRNFAEICKKRGLDLSNEQVDTPVVPGDTVSDGKMRDTDTKLDKYPMPDKAYNADDLAQHGIYDQNFLPISKDTAAEMIDRDLTVYAVTYDGAIMAFDREEVESYQDGTVFAMLREEWEQTTDFKDAVTDRMNRQQEREKAFLDHAGDSFAIYQLKRGEEYRDLSFESFDRLAQRGLSVNKDNYNLIYTAVSPYSGDRVQALEAIFHDFNVSKPADFGGHSLSVSDIVAIRQDGVLSCHYVDSFGFQELPNFLQPGNYLKSSEMQMEDDYNMVDGVINNVPKQPTVAELEEQAKSGQPISLMDLAGAVHREKEQKKQPERPGKKPSILAKIRRPLPSSEPTKTAPEKSAEKGFTR